MALHLDENGYLNDLEDWDEDAAHQLAALESIQLTQEHWELIEWLVDIMWNSTTHLL